MPKPQTFPILYNEALQISISKLKEWGYLEPCQIKSGTIIWSQNGNKIGSIAVQVNTINLQCPLVELEYEFRGEPRNYKVQLVSTPSNLGNGEIWYFICPQTDKRCRKLYSVGGYFLHREAFKNCMYESQTKSKKNRQIDKILGAYFKIDDLRSKLFTKHFKKMYAGKPTKTYLLIMKQLHKANSITYTEMEQALISSIGG